MKIFIDESGSFVPSSNLSWCATAGYVVSETGERRLFKILTDAKLRAGKGYRDEIKLRDVSETSLLRFLADLSSLDGLVFFALTEMSLLSKQALESERQSLVTSLRNIETSNRRYVESYNNAADCILALSPQLFMQLVSQVHLLHEILARSVSYYAVRRASTLRTFSWRIDQKNPTTNIFDVTFATVAPALLQWISVDRPIDRFRELDYRSMSRYFVDLPSGARAQNIAGILSDDIAFIDSKSSVGVQVIDLIASAVRRLFIGGFDRWAEVARFLGKIMVENPERGDLPAFVSFVEGPVVAPRVGVITSILFSERRRILPIDGSLRNVATTKDTHKSEFSYKSSGTFPTDDR